MATATPWPMVPFTDCLAPIKVRKNHKILARAYAKTGTIPIVDQGRELIAGWTNDDSSAINDQLPLVVFGDHTRIFKYVNFPFAPGADGTQLLKPQNEFNPCFFYFACLNVDLPSRGYNRHFSVLKEKQLPKPLKPEQEKIAALLWKIQRAIEVEEKLTATARELKQSAMRQLFSSGLHGEAHQETEIGLIPESWSLRPLEELREFLQYGTSAKCDYSKAGNPVLRIPNIVDGRIDSHDLKRCTLTAKEVDSLVLEDGDVLFIRTNGVRERVGSCAIYHGQPALSLFASYLIRARLKKDELNPDYFQYFSNTPVGRAQLAGRASPAADGKFNVNTKHIGSVLVPLPKEPEEQREIVNILQAIDRKIALHERKRASTQDLFQTLLYKLMTGEIRVADLDIDVSEVTQ